MSRPARGLGWKYDLPAPGNPPDSCPTKEHILVPPNHIDNAYIELPRSTFRVRGFNPIVGGSLLLGGFLALAFFIYEDLTSTHKRDLTGLLVFASIYALNFFFTFPYIRMDFECPRDEPIRFNRIRQKVYFYQYRYDRFHPFGRKNWGIKPIAYDWEQLTAETYSIYAPMGYGGRVEKIMISVHRPGTDEVIDRVFFTGDIEQGKQYWALVRIFMQKGPETLSTFIQAPTDWNSNDLPNPFHRMAPKVQWPAEMDLESRTAPSDN